MILCIYKENIFIMTRPLWHLLMTVSFDCIMIFKKQSIMKLIFL